MSRSALLVCSIAVASLSSAAARADLELPRPSPAARTSVTVGLTEVTVEYSSPAMKGRKIWGGLVPYGQVWRTGANAATKLTVSRDITIGDKPLAAGTYALYTIPNATSWTIVLNKGVNQSGLAYKQEEDVLRFEAKPHPSPMRERMTFLFSDYSDSVASLDLEWDKLRVSVPIKAKTEEQVAANIKAMTSNAWRPYANAARYLLESKKNPDQALELVEQSLAIKEEWLNVWIKAALLAQKGRYKEAYPLAERAQALGQKAEQFFLAPEVKKALTDWKAKL
jgi:hypothetical protein